MDSLPTFDHFRLQHGCTAIELHCNGCGRMVIRSFVEAKVKDTDTVATLARRVKPCSRCGSSNVQVRPRWPYQHPAK